MKYKYKRKPYKHQIAALRKLLENGFGGALLMEPRTGKTKVCIDYASIMHQAGKVNRVVVVCPVSVIDVWVREVQLNCPFNYRILVWDRDGRKSLNLPRFGKDTIDWIIINYDAFSTPGRMIGRDRNGNIKRSKSRGGRYDVKKRLLMWQPQLVILDESHRIKSPSAKKSTALVSLGKEIPYKVLATGTAVTKKKRVFDLYMQWKFMKPDSPLLLDEDGNRHTSGSFKAEYGKWLAKNGYEQWIAPRNQKRLHKLVHAESFAVTRDECYDLPPVFPDQIVKVQLKESARIYDEMAEQMIARIKSGEYTEATIKLVLNLRLSQITSGISKTVPSAQYPSGRLVRIGREKLRIMEDLFEDWFEQEEKLVVAARFRADIFGILKLAKTKFKIDGQVIVGGMTREERTRGIDKFREKPGPALMVMNPQAGSLGIDLSTAATMIWYSLPNSYVDYTQARDRIALAAKANRHLMLLGEGTYDELQYQTLQEDGDVVKAVMASPDILRRNFK